MCCCKKIVCVLLTAVFLGAVFYYFHSVSEGKKEMPGTLVRDAGERAGDFARDAGRKAEGLMKEAGDKMGGIMRGAGDAAGCALKNAGEMAEEKVNHVTEAFQTMHPNNHA